MRIKFVPLPTPDQIHKETSPSLLQEAREYVFYFLKVFFSIAILYLFIRTSVFDLIGVSGQSMYPNYNQNTKDDSIYIDQLTPKFSDYKRGEVVVLIAPKGCYSEANPPLYIKRIVGLPGEQVAFENGKVYIINDQYPSPGIELDETIYLPSTIPTFKNARQDDGMRYEEKKLGVNEYYFLGDNRTGSADSRICGTAMKERILGREFFRLSPPDKRGWFRVPRFNIGNQN